MRETPDEITELKNREVFVFGSNKLDVRYFVCEHCKNKCLISIIDCYDKPIRCALDNEHVAWKEFKNLTDALISRKNED